MKLILIAGLLVVGVRSTPIVNSQTTFVDDCEVGSTDSTKQCDNLLPPDFDRSKGDVALSSLADFVSKIPMQQKAVTQSRKSQWFPCNLSSSSTKNLSVTYSVPEAMKRFPRAGTGDRDIVTAYFAVNSDKGCWEHKYGVMRETKGRTRVVQFATLSMPDAAPSTISSDHWLGRWRTWAITARKVNNQLSEYQLDELEHGDYVWCFDTKSEDNVFGFLGAKAHVHFTRW